MTRSKKGMIFAIVGLILVTFSSTYQFDNSYHVEFYKLFQEHEYFKITEQPNLSIDPMIAFGAIFLAMGFRVMYWNGEEKLTALARKVMNKKYKYAVTMGFLALLLMFMIQYSIVIPHQTSALTFEESDKDRIEKLTESKRLDLMFQSLILFGIMSGILSIVTVFNRFKTNSWRKINNKYA